LFYENDPLVRLGKVVGKAFNPLRSPTAWVAALSAPRASEESNMVMRYNPIQGWGADVIEGVRGMMGYGNESAPAVEPTGETFDSLFEELPSPGGDVPQMPAQPQLNQNTNNINALRQMLGNQRRMV
jgi:hypothetical protein